MHKHTDITHLTSTPKKPKSSPNSTNWGDEDAASEKVTITSKGSKNQKKKKNHRRSISGSDSVLNHSAGETKVASDVLHEQRTIKLDTDTEVTDKVGVTSHSDSDWNGETTGKDGTVGPPNIEELDRIIDEGCDELELTTDKESVKKLDIFLPFEVPLSHTIEKHITHGISEHEHKKLKELNVRFKTGRFNPDEDDVLRANWEHFCRMYGISNPGPFLPGVQNGLDPIQRKKFVQWLGHGLENRSLNSILSRFRLLYSNTSNARRFTEFENQLIQRCLERNVEMPFVLLSKILKRDRYYISKHHRLTKKVPYAATEKVNWNLSVVKLFIEALLKSTGCSDVEELRDRPLPPHVWDNISEAIEIAASRCRAFWNRKLSTQLFAEEPLFMHHIWTTLLLRFLERPKKYVYWQNINWSKIAKHYKGVGPIFLFATFKSFIRSQVPKKKQRSLKACLKYLKKHWPEKLRAIKFKISLTRLRYINGQLIILSDR
ncbi:uncharacterized protein LOC134546201 [Bacillus rossius redtenbacheri]|uniref:uncharacterized protein LOC134546201 n=1 Tax=Bacillus rossius redtenbacheri TaxID=93214 RepID=UPI002FDEC710